MTRLATKRWLGLGSALAALTFATVATAQTEQPPITDTTPEPGQEKLPPCPMPQKAEEAMPAPAPAPQAELTPPPAAPAPAMVPEKTKRKHNIVFAPQEIQLATGAGVGNYFGKASPGALETGATWDARMTFGAQSIIALEAGYVGGINQVDVSGVNGHLNSNGIDSDFRLQLPYRYQPYVFSGVGYNHMKLDNTAGNPNVNTLVRTEDDQVMIPAGGGFAAYLGANKHLTLDLRGTYRYIPNNGITIMQTDSLHQWVAQARIGYTF